MGDSTNKRTLANSVPIDGMLSAAQRRLRSRCFVGRNAELRDFSELLASGVLPRLVFVHGPGGIGKSSLLDGFARIAEQMHAGFARLDARQLAASPAAVDQSVRRALDDLATSTEGPRVLALDHVEQLSALDGWLRGYLLPGLPADLLLVLASREAPDLHWRADPGLSELLSEYPLGPLDGDAMGDYLQRRGVDSDQRPAIHAFARGSPLALALAVDQVLREPDAPFEIDHLPDLIRGLLRWLLGGVEQSGHLLSLQACASVRLLDEPLLAALLDQTEASRAFDWLADQHFIEQRSDGLVVHDLVRDVVIRDLRSRNLERHHALIQRAANYFLHNADTTSTRFRLETVPALIYTLRQEAHIREHLHFGDVRCYPDGVQAGEIDALAGVVERHEGKQSRAWFEYWAYAGSTEIAVLRDAGRQPIALVLYLCLSLADDERDAGDPCVAALFRHLRAHAPLRANEQVLLARFRMACETHQARAPVWAELSARINGRMFTPGISLLAATADLAYSWTGMQENAEYSLLADSEFRLGGRSYKIAAHDLRREPALEWGQNTVERVLRGGHAPELKPAPVSLLDRRAFADAVRHTLQHYRDDGQLVKNPLLASPMLRRHAVRQTPESLRALIEETAAQHSAMAQNLLDITYFHPRGAKQQALARELCISERTLRRRLRDAQTALIDALWHLDTEP